MSIRLVVTISDTHCGSTYGLLPPGFRTIEGNEIGHNPIQEWLWAAWLDVNERLAAYVGDDPYGLVINGDTIEGVHHKTKEVISPDVSDHQEAAEQVLIPFAKKAAKVYVVEGTECHTGTTETKLAKKLKAIPDPEDQSPVRKRLSITVAGTGCCWFHHCPATSREYLKASALSIMLGNERVAAVAAKKTPPAVLGMAHRHTYGVYECTNGLAFVTPAWQGLTRHGRKYVPSARTSVGLVVLDWRNRPDGALPLLHPILAEPPPSQDESM